MPYRVVDVALWTDPRVKKLSVRGKLLFLYLITNPHTHVGGLYYLPDVMIQHETGLAAKELDTLWDTLSKLGLSRRDRQNEIVWVCNMFRYQGVHQKTVISVSHHLNTLHNSPLCKEFAERYPEVLTVKNGYRTDRVSEVGFSDQDQEQEQEQEQNTPPTPHGGATNGEVLPAGFHEFWTAYPNKTAKAAALKAWKKLAPNEALRAQMMAALERQKRSPRWLKDNGEYIPHPATWINGERWKDQPPAEAQSEIDLFLQRGKEFLPHDES